MNRPRKLGWLPAHGGKFKERRGVPRPRTEVQRTGLSVGLIAAIVGFLVVTQATTQMDVDERLKAQSPAELGQIISNLSAEKDLLRDEIAQLEDSLAESVVEERKRASIDEAAAVSREQMRIAAGELPVKGPGITVSLSDTQRALRSLDLSDLVRELYAAGAEGVAIEGKRVSVLTPFEDGRYVLLQGAELDPPLSISAIGDQERLIQAMTVAGGYVDAIDGVEGVSLTVRKAASVAVPAAQRRDFQYARPLSNIRSE